MTLSDLPNIGVEIERQLHAVEIHSVEELQAVGAEQAWLRILAMDTSACMNRLLALEGAVQSVKKTLLPPKRKAELWEFYQSHKSS